MIIWEYGTGNPITSKAELAELPHHCHNHTVIMQKTYSAERVSSDGRQNPQIEKQKTHSFYGWRTSNPGRCGPVQKYIATLDRTYKIAINS